MLYGISLSILDLQMKAHGFYSKGTLKKCITFIDFCKIIKEEPELKKNSFTGWNTAVILLHYLEGSEG